MEKSQKTDIEFLESKTNIELFEKEIALKKKELSKIFDSLQKKNQDFQPKAKDKDDAFSEILDFLQRKLVTFQDYDKMLFLKKEFEGLMIFAKIFKPPSWKLDDHENDFNDFYNDILKRAMDLPIMETDDDLDKYIKLGVSKKLEIEKQINEEIKEKKESLDEIFNSLDQKNLSYKKLTDSNGLNEIIDFLERKINCEKEMRDLRDIQSSMSGFFQGATIYSSPATNAQKKNEFQKFFSDMNQKIITLKFLEGVDKNEDVDVVKLLTETSKKNEEFSKENKNLKETIAGLDTLKKNNDLLSNKNKTLTEEIKKIKSLKDSQSGVIEKENIQKNTNLDEALIKKVNQELLAEYDEKAFQQKKKKLKEFYEGLEKENGDLKEKNTKLEQSLKKVNEKLSDLPKILNFMNQKFEDFKKKVAQPMVAMKKKLENYSELYRKLKAKFKIYKENYFKYSASYHVINFVLPVKDFLMYDRESVSVKALYDDIKDSSNLELQLTLPEKYRYIDKNFVDEKIQLLLSNIVRFNQFAKVFYNILKKFYPQTNSKDVFTEKINKSFGEIYEELKKLDTKMTNGYEDIMEKYKKIKFDQNSINKNYVEIWEKCLEMEYECINRILSLDSNYYYLREHLHL